MRWYREGEGEGEGEARVRLEEGRGGGGVLGVLGWTTLHAWWGGDGGGPG